MYIKNRQDMQEISIIDDKIICDGKACDPTGLWLTNAHCGNCSFIKFCEEFAELYYDGTTML